MTDVESTVTVPTNEAEDVHVASAVVDKEEEPAAGDGVPHDGEPAAPEGNGEIHEGETHGEEEVVDKGVDEAMNEADAASKLNDLGVSTEANHASDKVKESTAAAQNGDSKPTSGIDKAAKKPVDSSKAPSGKTAATKSSSVAPSVKKVSLDALLMFEI